MKKSIALVVVLVISIFAAACGKEQQPVDVMKTLKSEKVPSYAVHAEMKVNTGSHAQIYTVEVSYKQPDYYKVDIKNMEKGGQQQVILKNKKGVFIINPTLNKMFKFQSDWPDNGGQSYIYQALIKDILDDKDMKMKEGKKHYIFETKTRYAENKNIPTQKIALDKKTLAPKKVTVFDADKKELIVVTFDKMDFKPTFKKGDFSANEILSKGRENVPKSEGGNSEFTIKYPTGNAVGEQMTGERFLRDTVVMTFESGDKSYTLIERKAVPSDNAAVQNEVGDLVNLGVTMGSLSENAVAWTNSDVDFMVASDNLTQDELVQVASSVYISPEK